MSNYSLNLIVNGGEITGTESRLTADSVEYVTAVFTFDESWNELYKTAVFRVGERVYHAVLENDICTVPHEALSDGIMYISVFGVLDTTRATTNELPILVEKSGYVICEPAAPSPDPYAYFLEQATALRDESLQNAEQSKEASSKAALSAESADQSAADAKILSENAVGTYEATLGLYDDVKTIYDKSLSLEKNVTELSDITAQNADIAQKASNEAVSAVMANIESHNDEGNSLAHPNILNIALQAKSIAEGKATSLCFETAEQLNNWLSGSYTRSDGKTPSELKVGDNLYILQLGVPDYWWDGSDIQPLDAERPDLSDYYNKGEIDDKISNAYFKVMGRATYDAEYEQGSLDAGRIYFVYEEE